MAQLGINQEEKLIETSAERKNNPVKQNGSPEKKSENPADQST
jgi:hypothetical protein